MNDNISDFNSKYRRAILKTAIGIYIIRCASETLKYSKETVESNIDMLCGILADNIGVSKVSISEDANKAHDMLPMSYINELHESGMIQRLTDDLFRLKILKIA